MRSLTEVAPGVLVATSSYALTTSTVVVGSSGGCLVIDPAVTVADLAGLAAGLAARGLRPVAGWSTHPHWDHVLWSRELGDAPRYAAPAAVATARTERDGILEGVRNSAPGHGAVFLPESGVLIAGDMCSDVEIPLLDILAADPLGDYRTGMERLASVPGVRQVVPGHGHAGDAGELRRRLALDDAYLEAITSGKPAGDPRLTKDNPEWMRVMHDEQVRYFQG